MNKARAAQHLQRTPGMKEDKPVIIQELLAVFDSGFVDPSRLSNEPGGRVKDELGEGRDLIGRVLTPTNDHRLQLVPVEDAEFGLVWLVSERLCPMCRPCVKASIPGFDSFEGQLAISCEPLACLLRRVNGSRFIAISVRELRNGPGCGRLRPAVRVSAR